MLPLQKKTKLILLKQKLSKTKISNLKNSVTKLGRVYPELVVGEAHLNNMRIYTMVFYIICPLHQYTLTQDLPTLCIC